MKRTWVFVLGMLLGSVVGATVVGPKITGGSGYLSGWSVTYTVNESVYDYNTGDYVYVTFDGTCYVPYVWVSTRTIDCN